jgi:dTDP-4-amino-4,6-dideoxygalactose transaminase
VVPFVDLKAQYQSIKAEIDSAVMATLASTQFVLGADVAAFEQDFARFCGARDAIAVNSGTSALHLALLAAGVAPGDEVITVPMTFVATVAAIGYCGARPVFIDIDPVTYTMDPSQLEGAITPRTKAIMPVHLYGQMADMDPIMAVARRHGVKVIEDAAQAHGAEYNGRRAGGIGDAAGFSFYPGKNLGAYGEGGAVVTNDDAIAHQVRLLRDWGQEGKYNHIVKGFNYRMEGIQGAVLRTKLPWLERWTSLRGQKAAAYLELLRDTGLQLPATRPGSRHVWHVFGLLTDRRAELQSHLTSCQVQSGIHYPFPVHLLPAWTELGYRKGMFPRSEKVAARELSLPMFPELTDQQIETVCTVVREFAETAECATR